MAASIFQLQKLSSTPHIKKLPRDLLINKPGRRWSSKYFLTTPIFYVNAEPHMGHLYTALIGDAANRFQKLKNPDLKTKYMVGTDEHGLKVSQAASGANEDVKLFCDRVSNKYKELFELFNIEYDDFVRTTEDRHKKAAVSLWNKIFSKNLIYLDNYSGWYSVADEMFVSEQYLSPEIGQDGERYTLEGRKKVFFMEEPNYKFKLKSFEKDLLNWVKDEVVKPEIFHRILLKWFEEENILNDISVSRPAERVPWGIPVPGDPSQTIYVWLDALSSYLCANGYPDSDFKWPPDVQIVGKDILKFHVIFWPAFLMAADLEPPRCIFCHSHWLKDGEKMSKFAKNVVDPFTSSKELTSDGLRYFLLRGGVPQNDGNFSTGKVIRCLNSELAHSLGNLLLRSTSPKVNPHLVFPGLFENYRTFTSSETDFLMSTLEELPGKVTAHFEEMNFYKGIDEIMGAVHNTNKFFHSRRPWKSDPEDHRKLTLLLTMEALRCCGILLQPIVPNISGMILDRLSVPVGRRRFADIRPFSWERKPNFPIEDVPLTGGSIRLFKMIEVEKNSESEYLSSKQRKHPRDYQALERKKK